jgi:hypothetical protein
MTSFNYYDFRQRMVTDNIITEINYYENSEINFCEQVKEYVEYLKNRIGINTIKSDKTYQYDKYGNRKEFNKIVIDDYAKNLDDKVYHMQWKKLKLVHKAKKIGEFIDSLEYDEKLGKNKINKNREDIKKQLVKGIEEKRFLANKNTILYDDVNSCIKSIDCLTFNKKTKLYEIEWN